ncbi:MAG: 50S ribosomal protein L10 [Acholeplasmatales bacterium]|jgi:large subunit ribosomal protein L10|nr:50S ribosomal protein L10 [Acholeplasmatales bacterium]
MNKNVLEKKQKDVELLTEKLKRAKTVVSFDYPGLTVDAFMKLRRKLREAKVEVTVFKNNISRRASVNIGQNEFGDSLVGAKALAISYDDVVAPAKIVYDFQKENKAVKLQTGIVEGHFASVSEIEALATIPSRETLLAQLAYSLQAPLYQLAFCLDKIEK